jgi:hypothetical protein
MFFSNLPTIARYLIVIVALTFSSIVSHMIMKKIKPNVDEEHPDTEYNVFYFILSIIILVLLTVLASGINDTLR